MRIYDGFRKLNKKEFNSIMRFIELSEPEETPRKIEFYLKVFWLGLIPITEIKPRFIRIIKSFDRFVKYFFHDLDFGAVDRVLRKFRKINAIKHMRLNKKIVLADIGCGRQASLGWDIRKKVKKYIAVDRDIPNFNFKNMRFIKSTGEEVHKKVGAEIVDVVTVLAVIEHIKNPDIFLKSCKKILAKNGKIVFTTPPPISKSLLDLLSKLRIINKDEIEEHVGYYTKESLGKILDENGFEVIEYKRFLFGLNSLLVAQKR